MLFRSGKRVASANQSLETQSRDDSLAGQAHERANARIVDGYLIGLSALALPALAASLYRVVEVGWLPIMGLHTALAVGVFGVTAARRRLPYLFRALFVVAIGMAIAVGALMTSGLRAQPLMFFSATLVTAFLLLGLRWGIATTAVAIGTYVATYFLEIGRAHV